MKVQADNFSGVYEVKEFEVVEVSEQVFYMCLKDNTEDSILCTELSIEMVEKIAEEYGIKKLIG